MMELTQVNEVAFMLSKIQNEVRVLKNNYNSFGKYKYRSVEDIQVAIKPILLKYEATIVISDSTNEVCGIPVITATATFICPYGELSVSAQAGVQVEKKGMDIAQTFGSSSSYARKYALGGLLLLDDTADADATNKGSKSDVVLKSLTDAQLQRAIDAGKAQEVLNGLDVTYKLSLEQVELLKSAM